VKRAVEEKAAQFDMQNETYLTTFLVSYRRTADRLNAATLDSLVTDDHNWHIAVDREDGKVLSGDAHLRTFKRGTNFPLQVDCIVGAKVMFLNNTMLTVGISNGSCGVVVSLRGQGLPNVAFAVAEGIRVSEMTSVGSIKANVKKVVEVDRDISNFTANGIPYTRQQLPLQNAFALTVHKTQDLSLPRISINLDDEMLAPGQAYTAISRARRWEDLLIAALSWSAIKVNEEAAKEYERLEKKEQQFRRLTLHGSRVH
jgi:ATP-dependent exoDNAse (exonuclease V) alpha subunit